MGADARELTEALRISMEMAKLTRGNPVDFGLLLERVTLLSLPIAFKVENVDDALVDLWASQIKNTLRLRAAMRAAGAAP